MANVIQGPAGGGAWLPGTDGDDDIYAYGDLNSLFGYTAAMKGGDINNYFIMGGSHNTLTGGPGIDHFNGGTGIDNSVTYQLSKGFVTASLADPSINTGDAKGDTYTNIYQLTGSPAGSDLYAENSGHQDQLWGLAGTNNLFGGTGYCTMISGPGADHMVGGAGKGLVDYEVAKSGLTASLANSSINAGEAAGDTYQNLGDLAGSFFDDVLYGDANNNNMLGNPGNDTMYAGAGSDTLTGGPGADVLTGGPGGDWFVFTSDDLKDARNGITDRVVDFDQGNSGHFDINEFDALEMSQVGVSASNIRVFEYSSNTFAELQINDNGSWINFARLDGLHVGDSVRVLLPGAPQNGDFFAIQQTVKIPANTDLGTHGATWPISGIGDFNGDGTSDVLWRSPGTGQVDQWQLQNGSWSKSIDLGATKATNWQLAGVGDFNGDGTSDVLWRDANTSQVDHWQMKNGNWSQSIDLGATKNADWSLAGVGDFNGDGTTDVLWRNVNTSQVDQWQMKNGNWSQSIDLGATKNADWMVAEIGDFNGDGTSDILWRNVKTAQVDEWTMKNGNWAQSIDLGATKDANWAVAGVGDFNHDGRSDILWYNTSTGQEEYWAMNNGNWAGSVNVGTNSTTMVPVGTGDFNHDGISDALFLNTANQHVYEQLSLFMP